METEIITSLMVALSSLALLLEKQLSLLEPVQRPLAPQEIRLLLNNIFPDDPRMICVAKHESQFRQFDDYGNVITSHTRDVGVLQINLTAHADRAEELGIDLHTLGGNLQFGRLLYEEEGIGPWVTKKYCMG